MKLKKLLNPESRSEKKSGSNAIQKPKETVRNKIGKIRKSIKKKGDGARKNSVYNLLDEQVFEEPAKNEEPKKIKNKSSLFTKNKKDVITEVTDNECLKTKSKFGLFKKSEKKAVLNENQKTVRNDEKKNRTLKTKYSENVAENGKSDVDDLNTSVKEPVLPESSDSRDSRTIFIGNLPVNFHKKKLMKLLKEHGNLEKMWTRGAKPLSTKLPKKVAVNKNMLPEDHPPLMVYVLFKTAADARNALKLNGIVFQDHRLRVTSSREKVHAPNKGVFVGNLPFNIKDDELYDMFEQCGEIIGVRVVRDPKNGIGKGFGYVNFKSADSVELALNLNEEKLNGREIRVSRLFTERKKKKMDKKKEKQLMNSNQKTPASSSTKKKISSKANSSDKPRKKKPKLTATELKKKVLAEKLSIKPKKKKNEVLI